MTTNFTYFVCLGGYTAKAVLSGPRYQLGDFHECIENFQEQYCLIDIQFSAGKKTSTVWNNIKVINIPMLLMHLLTEC